MRRLGLERDVVDPDVYRRTVERFREAGIIMPTFAQLADPSTIPADIAAEVHEVEPDAPHPRNLFRAHWYNGWGSPDPLALPEHVVLPPELTGVESPIVVLLGDRFPMIHSHKVIAAYGCLAPRIVTGQFDPTSQRAVWPSTGNYCRGGVAISRIMLSHGVAVLPEGMSQERFDWLMAWVADPSDIIRTPGTESNVKEIYDKCAELDRDPRHGHLQPVLGVREPHRPLRDHRAGHRARLRVAARAAAGPPPGSLHVCHRLRRRHRRR